MRSMSFFAKCKKAFTLVELIAVMVIMAIGAAIVLPNIRGMISKAEESTYKNYCVEATSYVRSYTNLMTLGIYDVPYEKGGKILDESGNPYKFVISSPSGLKSALNEYNLESSYQFYVLAFDDASMKSDPTSSVQSLINKNSLEKKDVMITVITPSSGGRVSKYTLRGFWYYSYSKGKIVYYYYAPNKRCGTGFAKLTSDGK